MGYLCWHTEKVLFVASLAGAVIGTMCASTNDSTMFEANVEAFLY